MSQTHNCVNCNSWFDNQDLYKQHYKSEHHRYNIKRKLIGLLPLSLEEYTNQFDSEISSKSSDQKQLHCEICSKSFLSVNTYKHHMNSQKHKKNRKKIIQKPGSLSKSSSESDFSVLGLEKAHKCMFCNEFSTKEHLKIKHNFPPFAAECVDENELSVYVMNKIKEGNCVFCQTHFDNQQSVKQHMTDLGHAKLDIDNFHQYEKFYLWKIQQTSSEDEAQVLTEEPCVQKRDDMIEQSFEDLGHPTLQMLEQRRQRRIKLTNTGAIINGKQVGYRHLKQYYKQYVGRNYPDHKLVVDQKGLEYNPVEWKLAKRSNIGCASIHFGTGR